MASKLIMRRPVTKLFIVNTLYFPFFGCVIQDEMEKADATEESPPAEVKEVRFFGAY